MSVSDANTNENRNENLNENSNVPVGYAAAVTELDAILRELEGSDVDVDRLADRVARAATLITFCRERIETARSSIETVVAELE